jgi:putative membrane protein
VSEAGGHPGPGVEVHRLHPLTVLLEVGQVLGRFLWFFVLVFVVGWLGGRQTDPATWLFFLAGSGVLVALARYLSLRYWVEGGRLVIRSGIVSQQLRTIPLDKIQNVELRQGAIHQLAGVVDFRIETAAGPEAEAHLAVLARDAAERLKADLLAGRGAAVRDADAAPVSQVIWKASPGDLLLLGASSNRAGAILGAIVGLLVFVGRELPQHVETLRRGLDGIVGTVTVATAATVFVAALLLVGWLLSIGLTVIGYYGFTVTREPDGRLRRRYGLLSRLETVVNPARIQLLRLGASWLRRRLGFWEVAAHTAGAAWDGQRAGSALLCPLLRKRDLPGFCDRLLPSLDLDAVTWQPVSRATIRRGFIRYLLLVLVALGAWAAALGPWVWAGIVPGGLVAWASARRRYRVLAYARHAGHLLARTGVLHRRLTIVPESKVQWVGLTESPPQRRLGIATMTVSTAAGSAHVVDLDRGEAIALQRDLSGAASAAGAWLPDAV